MLRVNKGVLKVRFDKTIHCGHFNNIVLPECL